LYKNTTIQKPFKRREHFIKHKQSLKHLEVAILNNVASKQEKELHAVLMTEKSNYVIIKNQSKEERKESVEEDEQDEAEEAEEEQEEDEEQEETDEEEEEQEKAEEQEEEEDEEQEKTETQETIIEQSED